ncbi:hypothetical protein DN412_15115 [Cupriavidus lacunae]|uniref:Uncharacterized protein n=1 Tax=Cupriavidus lacunae TaxID=2666307 RepID=A0A370NUZ7_9BURK|nr:hypothetical protein DN412_15115 [Cupriavidus lacunae]
MAAKPVLHGDTGATLVANRHGHAQSGARDCRAHRYQARRRKPAFGCMNEATSTLTRAACLGEFEWPKVGEFNPASGEKRGSEGVSGNLVRGKHLSL